MVVFLLEGDDVDVDVPKHARPQLVAHTITVQHTTINTGKVRTCGKQAQSICRGVVESVRWECGEGGVNEFDTSGDSRYWHF